eukprot:747707-Hanusia_phi.AAC.1
MSVAAACLRLLVHLPGTGTEAPRGPGRRATGPAGRAGPRFGVTFSDFTVVLCSSVQLPVETLPTVIRDESRDGH